MSGRCSGSYANVLEVQIGLTLNGAINLVVNRFFINLDTSRRVYTRRVNPTEILTA
jgi:hypothetical protein